MYGCESWTIKKHWRTDTFELWCWRRLLRVPWTKEIKPVNPEGNQSWIFIGRTDVEAEAPVLWPSDMKNWLIGKDPDAGKAKGEEGDRGWDGWMASLTQGDMSLSKLREVVKNREAWYATVHGVSKSCTWLSDWRTAKGSHEKEIISKNIRWLRCT